ASTSRIARIRSGHWLIDLEKTLDMTQRTGPEKLSSEKQVRPSGQAEKSDPSENFPVIIQLPVEFRGTARRSGFTEGTSAPRGRDVMDSPRAPVKNAEKPASENPAAAFFTNDLRETF